MTLKRQLSDAEEELRDLLTYKCPNTGKPRCPPCSAKTLIDITIAEGFFPLVKWPLIDLGVSKNIPKNREPPNHQF